jgi:DNA polymerase delta subunit 1
MTSRLRPEEENGKTHIFQLIDVHIAERDPIEFSYTRPKPNDISHEIHGEEFLTMTCDLESDYSKYCKVLLFGTTMKGNSILVNVSGFKPYLFYKKDNMSEQSLKNKLTRLLNLRDESILSTKVIKRKTLYGWEPNKISFPNERKNHEFIQVFFPNIFIMKKAIYCKQLKCHEGNIGGETKFMDSLDIVPSSWVEVCGKEIELESRISHCKIEISCEMTDLKPVNRFEIAPLLVAALDIECVSSTGAFPEASIPDDKITQIGIVLWRIGMKKEDAVKCIFVVGECDDIDNVLVYRFTAERDMLSYVRTFLETEDPDIIATYNGFGFDNEYMWKRAELLGCEDFFYLNRLIVSKSKGAVKELSSSALGSNELFIINMIGRCNLDIFHWVKAREKLESYKLDDVCAHFLGEKKVEMDYKDLFKLCTGSASDIAKVAVYCVQDCALLISLILRLQIITANVEMSRVCFTPMEALVTRGQQFKVMNQLVHYGHRENYILNTPERYSGSAGDSYEGATVIDAKAKYYKNPIAVLDFMSLYPSIMLANNFCYSTLVLDPRYMNLPGVVYETIKVTDEKVYVWVKGIQQEDGSVKPMIGLLHIMLDNLLSERKVAKKAKANAKSPEEKAVFDAKQLALKISANSIYGFTGAVAMGKYHCLAIADSTTWKAREMLNQTKTWVMDLYKCDVVYGDTDSVMVLFFEAETIEKSFELGDEAAEKITQLFSEKYNTKRIVLEMEKVYYPYLLMRKKRYAGLMYEKNSKGTVEFSYLDAKGIELVRRDNCALAKKVQSEVLDALMYKMSPELACEKLQQNLGEITNNNIPNSEYKMSKSRRKTYKNEELPHIKVVKKMRARNPGSEPQIGDRVPFVLIETSDKKAKACDKAEDPKYVIEHNLKIDRLYYVEHQIIKPICGLLDFVLDDAQSLFTECRRKLTHQRDKQNTIFSFLKRKSPEKSEEETTKPKEIEETTIMLTSSSFADSMMNIGTYKPQKKIRQKATKK